MLIPRITAFELVQPGLLDLKCRDKLFYSMKFESLSFFPLHAALPNHFSLKAIHIYRWQSRFLDFKAPGCKFGI